jgi:hypothetical protein
VAKRAIEHRAEPGRVVRGDEVDRAPQQRHADGPAFGEERGQQLRAEPLDPAPQRHVRIETLLPLEPD